MDAYLLVVLSYSSYYLEQDKNFWETTKNPKGISIIVRIYISYLSTLIIWSLVQHNTNAVTNQEDGNGKFWTK